VTKRRKYPHINKENTWFRLSKLIKRAKSTYPQKTHKRRKFYFESSINMYQMAITEVAAKKPQRLAQLVYVDAYLRIEEENEITPWSTPIEGDGTDFISR
jgi:hypothetical protein